jgi:hypothetical protein
MILVPTCIGYGNCSGNGRCDLESGKCICDAGFYGTDCQRELAFLNLIDQLTSQFHKLSLETQKQVLVIHDIFRQYSDISKISLQLQGMLCYFKCLSWLAIETGV